LRRGQHSSAQRWWSSHSASVEFIAENGGGPTGSEWIHELKWDGFRIIARSAGGMTRLWSRTARDWSASFPLITGTG
jgi:hypothetical protein